VRQVSFPLPHATRHLPGRAAGQAALLSSRRRARPVGARVTALAAGVLAVVGSWAVVAPAGSATAAVPTPSASGGSPVKVVAAENEYGNVAGQIGGRYVQVSSIMSNPNTDPHTFEVNPEVAREVSAAQLVIQNGVGYDTFMSKIESASPSSSRQVIDVQHLLGLPNDTPNPHLWYKPTTMPRVADALAADLAKMDPAHAAYFRASARRFITSLNPWLAAIAKLRATYPRAPVATTEPVSDYLLQAAGIDNMTPFGLQADIMNGVDPSPQDVSFQRSLFSQHKVKVFVYNQQVTDSLTQSFIADAKAAGIPVVGVYETMPVPGYDYQSWMMAEVHALDQALAHKISTVRLTGAGN
jgi:zinc/manganese transport system substrate-binding protein